ncbi:MAG: MFS transporter, partial [Gammaproteobacteria bacterium RIFCSPHIGHO2_12_FULL_45_9]
SYWPVLGSVGLVSTVAGAANWLHGKSFGPYLFFTGLAFFLSILYGWFGTVIRENRLGLTNDPQVDRSFRWGMAWFIFSEVMFFSVFFGALFYARVLSVPWLGGDGTGVMTHLLLWPNFQATWPVFMTPNPAIFHGPQEVMETWGIPAMNTLILLSSGGTITVAHWALLKNKRTLMLWAQFVTILLGITFLMCQVHEYGLAYLTKELKLSSGIYGTTFFMLTGFHALHVTVGTTMLIVMFYRMLRRDFTSQHHFAFEAAAWYWHFVDVVWLGLFIFVYWI